MRVDDVRFLTPYLAKDLPERDNVLRRELAAHLFDEQRLNAMLLGDVVHALFALGDRPGDEHRFKFAVVQFLGEPDDMPLARRR